MEVTLVGMIFVAGKSKLFHPDLKGTSDHKQMMRVQAGQAKVICKLDIKIYSPLQSMKSLLVVPRLSSACLLAIRLSGHFHSQIPKSRRRLVHLK